jgi:hypothetical protein
MPHITRLKQVRKRGNLIIVLIIGYNNYYIHFKKIITEILISYKHTILRRYKFITLKSILKPVLLNNELDTKLFLLSITCNTLIRVRSFLKVIFNMTFPISNTLEVHKFSMYRFSLYTFL